MVAPDLIGCLLVKQETNGKHLWGVIVETEAYSEEEPACHGYHKRTDKNETLFGPPGHLYIYLTYGMYYCVNIVTDRSNWANGVLLRSVALPDEDERIASGPGLLAKRFGLNKDFDNTPISSGNRLWIAERPRSMQISKIINTTRIGISKAKELHWRWYLQNSRSISKRAKGDRCPPSSKAWQPIIEEGP
ncbi:MULTISPECIES: DNA-3-methyladenine glycosylase [Prochlorococcus]|uniref:DNA-3-methyladenine glycosylase n=1 Tax=Prochlorococcus TaxID=1218 RepID=UPI00053372D5|nr:MULTISPECIES: DNA-3-methyladenine glycosylase [Prochlorococcus]KGG13132.1 DNA-3-methyladenine glycosylase II [Prochlorococcus sp. MIT 0601]